MVLIRRWSCGSWPSCRRTAHMGLDVSYGCVTPAGAPKGPPGRPAFG